MAINVDQRVAEQILKKAFEEKRESDLKISNLVNDVILGNHLTYRYILVTGILAKATNVSANPIALQVKAEEDGVVGAYDARSLCHSVVVPFDLNHLSKALGGSNEPFLNKPARFKTMSRNNAVRRGYDESIRDKVIQVFEFLQQCNEPVLTAKKLLSHCFFVLDEVIEKNKSLISVEGITSSDLLDVYAFISKFIQMSNEGESCAIVVGTLEKLYFKQAKGSYKVITHKVNEAGASSKEVGDIDIFNNGEYSFSIEVKDKNFTENDLAFAFDKMMRNHAKKGSFIYGPQANFNKDALLVKLHNYESKKFMPLFIDVRNFARMMIFHIEGLTVQSFFEELVVTAQEIQAKNQTMVWLQQVKKDILS